METKNVLYAAVGAPVVVARRVGDKFHDLRVRLNEGASEASKAAEKALSDWAAEGEKVVGRLTDRKMVDELTAKVDLDQAKEQVTRLRDQLEDMLDTWRHSFRPEQAEEKPAEPAPKTSAAPAVKTTAKAPAKKPAARKPAASKPTSKTGTKASAAKTTKSAATKKSSDEPAETKPSKAS